MQTRFLLYAHNGFGLGHFSRLSKIARHLDSELGKIAFLVLTQCAEAHTLGIPPSADLVRIPEVESTDDYAMSRRLPLPFEPVHQIRREVMSAAGLAFRPDVFLADHAPTGVRGDLLPMLHALRRLSRPPRMICGLLDMLGPEYVRAKWHGNGTIAALDELYDEIWVFGCRDVFDVAAAYDLPGAVARKIRYCGYIGVDPPSGPREAVLDELGVGERRLAVVTTGGLGSEADRLPGSYLDALDRLPAEARLFSLIVTGSRYGPEATAALRERCAEMARAQPHARAFRVIDFSPRLLSYLAAADSVVSHGGYNAVTEALSLGIRPIVVPLEKSNREQALRAEIFSDMGLVHMVSSEAPNADAIARALLASFKDAPLSRADLHEFGIRFSGLTSVAERLRQITRPGSADN